MDKFDKVEITVMGAIFLLLIGFFLLIAQATAGKDARCRMLVEAKVDPITIDGACR